MRGGGINTACILIRQLRKWDDEKLRNNIFVLIQHKVYWYEDIYYMDFLFFLRGINVLIQTSVAYWPDNWGRCEGSVVFVRRVARRRMMMWDTAAASVRDHCGWFQKGRHHCLAWSQLCFLILLNHCHTVKNKQYMLLIFTLCILTTKNKDVVDIYQQHIMAI